MAGEIRREAHAKLNLFLRVLAEREDGYHDLESLILPISLHDTVVCREGDSLRLVVVDGDGSLTDGPNNLATIAALALAERAGLPGIGAMVELTKRVPVAAGLGGGSADAAAVLHALNDLWHCGLDDVALLDLAADIGSDVPAAVAGRPVLVAGRGERLQPVQVPETWWVIVPADFQVRTPDAFRWWDEDASVTGPDPEPFVEALGVGDLEAVASLMFNDLEPPVFARHPEVRETRDRLFAAGALAAIMCGSGPTVAGLFPSEASATGTAATFPGSFAAAGLRG